MAVPASKASVAEFSSMKAVMSTDRKYLTDEEICQLAKAAKARGRYGDRDYAMVLVMWRHGLRASEVGLLRWDRVDFKKGEIWVQRLKGSRSCMHPMWPDERKALLKISKTARTPYLFASERGDPMSRRNVDRIVRTVGRSASFKFDINPHMLRHACGYHHANKGSDIFQVQRLLGHANIQHTIRYCELAPGALRQLLD